MDTVWRDIISKYLVLLMEKSAFVVDMNMEIGMIGSS